MKFSKYLSVDNMSGPEQGHVDKRYCSQGAPSVVLRRRQIFNKLQTMS